MNIIFFFSCLVSIFVAIIDVKTRTIPNIYTYGLGVCNILALLFFVPASQWDLYLLNFALYFILGMIFFALKIMGGGDIKLILAISLLIPLPSGLEWFLCIILFGGIQALITILLWKQKTIPYGIAISGGTLLYSVLLLL